ncbi:MAG: hypothetical protein P4L53_14270, partial [Candidatus Obscuribacterales bacterium]|nr:hypothetical protein [Candidatus Obscuribacterales bacterium]
MVTSRGASDDACLDSKNQASPPRGDELHKRHENADSTDCKLNLNALSADTKQQVAAKVKIESTANNLPSLDLTNLKGLSTLSANPLLKTMQGQTDDNVRAADAFKNLLQAATALDQTSTPSVAFPVHSGPIEIATTAVIPTPTGTKDQTSVLSVATDNNGQSKNSTPIFTSFKPTLVVTTESAGSVVDPAQPANARAFSGSPSTDLASLITPAPIAIADTSVTATKILATNGAADKELPQVLKTALVASAAEPGQVAIMRTLKGSPSMDLASLATPASNLVTDTPSPLASSRVTNGAAITKITADSIGAEPNATPTFKAFTSAPVLKTEFVASAGELGQVAITRTLNGSPSLDLASLATPASNLITETIPTASSSHPADAATIAKVSTESLGVNPNASPAFASFKPATVLKTDFVVTAATEPAPPAMTRQSIVSPSMDLASIATLPANLVADNTPTITSSRIADSAAIAKATADGTLVDANAAVTLPSFKPAPVLKTDFVATESAPPVIKTQSNLAPAADLASISTPPAKLVADNSPTITSSRIADSAAIA